MRPDRRTTVCYIAPGQNLLSSAGPSRNVLSVATAMSRYAEVTVAFRSVSDPHAELPVPVAEIDPQGGRPAPTPDDAAVRSIGYGEFARYLRSLNRFVHQRLYRFDVVLEKSWLLSGLVSWLCRRQGIAAIPVENYVPSPRQGTRQDALAELRLGLGRSIAGFCLRRAPALIAETQQLKGSIADRWKVEPDLIEVIGLGVDRELFRPADQAAARRELGLSADSTNLAYVGVLDRAHDLEPLIGALRQVKRRDVHLHVVGDGALRSQYEELAQSVPCPIVFHGRVSHQMVPHYIASADLCLAPYDPGWFPGGEVAYSTLKIREYLSSGRPVASVPSGSIVELISHGENGFLLANSVEGWVRLLAELPSREVLARMGERAAETTIPDWAEVAQRYLDVCERVLAQARLGS